MQFFLTSSVLKDIKIEYEMLKIFEFYSANEDPPDGEKAIDKTKLCYRLSVCETDQTSFRMGSKINKVLHIALSNEYKK
ncbi:hypothetical protein V1478_011238 [Vespula squamosa]|uniref:Uncharacterized protein n=1 Tax=Vespula squamosa TaxID=30214 RepID=A0ABD2ADX4_VESSQ